MAARRRVGGIGEQQAAAVIVDLDVAYGSQPLGNLPRDVHVLGTDRCAVAIVQVGAEVEGDLLSQVLLLEHTVVMLCSEFGRMPMFQLGNTGRDHNPGGFTVWLAGGGIRPGVRIGRTDEVSITYEKVHERLADYLYQTRLGEEYSAFIDELRENFSVVIVTHSMQQASRVSQRTAYFHLGLLIEVGPTDQLFTRPLHQLTQDYITGRFG